MIPARSEGNGGGPTFLKARFPSITERPSLDHPAVNVPATEVLAVLKCLRDELAFDLLADVTAVDWGLGASPRFTALYHVFSTARHDYMRVAVDCPNDAEPVLPSATDLWPAADWHEREVYDMFGVTFTGHPNLRRILMWDGYPHYPLRKDFPLAGIETELPDNEVGAETGAAVRPAPLVGGPFVASPGRVNLSDAEPAGKDETWTEGRVKPQ